MDKNRNSHMKLTDADLVKVDCTVANSVTEEVWEFKRFVTVGIQENGETVIVAADLREIAKALDTLLKVYQTAMNMASPKVQREVERDLVIEAVEERIRKGEREGRENP